ncbi:MAG: molybdenum cofactor biosynthesis protein MoeB, partial [Dinghuibacter sp.]|nr:molybdenum cofactor biosynthesis protein MoeB [Dinghuibacter sp.]
PAVEKPVREILPEELYQWQVTGKLFQFIDVREPDEYERVNLGAELIPLGVVLDHAPEISLDVPVVIHCKGGTRSAKAIRQLEKQFGFSNLYNLKGGILAYIDEIKPELQKY